MYHCIGNAHTASHKYAMDFATLGSCFDTRVRPACVFVGVPLQGAVACNVQRTTYATHITTTPQWMASATTIPTAWDGAVVSV